MSTDRRQILARVRHIDTVERKAILELRDGTFLTHELYDEDSDYGEGPLSVGDRVFVGPGWDDIELAQPALWPDDQYIGTVRHITKAEVVVEAGLRLRSFERPANLELAINDAVKISELSGIVERIANHPISTVEIGSSEQTNLSLFKFDPSSSPTLKDFAGFHAIKERATELIELQLEKAASLIAMGATPIKGVLFSGPSGNGKTMLARIIANAANAECYLISGPQILSKWYGQSEQLLREIFSDAKKQDRAVVVIDEVDSLAGQRSEDSHEVSRRVVGQLLTEMDGFAPSKKIVVVATTNRPNDLDIALRRPGRFDWEVVFSNPDRNDRIEILQKLAEGIPHASEIPYDAIADVTENWSASHLKAVWNNAAMLAVKEGHEMVLLEDYLMAFERVATQFALSQGSSGVATRRMTR